MSKRYISLGSTCGVAYQLQSLGLKQESLPFDWIKSQDLESIYSAIVNGFNIFGDFNNLTLHTTSSKHPILETDDWINNLNTNKSFVYKNSINMMFYHDFNTEIKSSTDQTYQEFREKYMRRFNRFYDLFSSGNELIFIRDEHKPNKLSPELIVMLVELLKSILTNGTTMNFILVVNNPRNKQYEWFDLETKLGIRIVNDTNKIMGWQRSNIDWSAILTKNSI
ncbi:papain-like cysteine peptidase [Cotonvirus japonicus]|uniref:Papain-like cysteine peptidase n=1 Tax=Cotonvirus japonicus TaxID=2811091 RepID=A0ABM7NSM6_9VIRU|nr:papain-like cysteine peptidase [Cotonvirus japonicus]BCS83149.1 papain-like cysteine peptidase [Cotonvirus japonicus]